MAFFLSISRDEMKQFALPSKRRRVLLTCLAGLLLAVCAYCFTGDKPRPLTAEEQQLVGKWAPNVPGPIRVYHADRSFSTVDGYFKGTWRIHGGKLTVIYWEPFALPRSFSMSSFSQSWSGMQRSFEKHTYTRKIQFSGNPRAHILKEPTGDTQHPDGNWVWTRREK